MVLFPCLSPPLPRPLRLCWAQVEKIMLPYSKEDPTKYREYGFVHYKERAGALEAVNRSHDAKPLLDGKELSVRAYVCVARWL